MPKGQHRLLYEWALPCAGREYVCSSSMPERDLGIAFKPLTARPIPYLLMSCLRNTVCTPFDTTGLLQESRPAHPAWPSSGVAAPPCELTRHARAPGGDGPNASKRTPGTQQTNPPTGRCYTTPRLLRPLVSCRNHGGPLWETREPNVGIAGPLVGTAPPLVGSGA